MLHPRTLLVARFALIIASLCYSVLERATNRVPGDDALEPLPQSLLDTMYARVVDLGRRFATLAARLEAGTLRIVRPRPSRAGATRATPTCAADAEATQLGEAVTPLPRDFGWFCRLSPHAHSAAAHMHLLLKDPEMAALVAKHPSFGRIIRPLCHMLAIKPQPHLLALQPLPARPRRERPARTEEQERHAELFSRNMAFGSPRPRRCAKNT